MTPEAFEECMLDLARNHADRPLEKFLSALLAGLDGPGHASMAAQELVRWIDLGFKGAPASESLLRSLSKQHALRQRREDAEMAALLRSGVMKTQGTIRARMASATRKTVMETLAVYVIEIEGFKNAGKWRVQEFDGHALDLDGWVNLDPYSFVECGVAGAMSLFEDETLPTSQVPWGWVLAFIERGKFYE